MPAWPLAATLGAAIASAAPVRADLHLDTPTPMLSRGAPLDSPTGLKAGLPQIAAGGTNLAVMVLWPPRAASHRAHAEALLTRLQGEVDRLPGVERVDDPAAARAAVEAGRVAILVAMEGAHGLGTGPWEPALDAFWAGGLRMLGLTWSLSNRFAGSSADDGGGLTVEGRALVAEARRRGLLLDLSHASRQTTLEVCRAAPAPVVASHSNAHALTPANRNLTDDEIRCIAQTGGVVGVMLHAPFLGKGADVRAVADHADHIVSIGGPGAVALGTDFDGLIRPPRGLEDASKLPALWAELRRRGWSEAQIAGMQGANFMRAWEGAWSARTAP